MRLLARSVPPSATPVVLPLAQVQPNALPAVPVSRVSVNERLRIRAPDDGIVCSAENAQPVPSTPTGTTQQSTINVTPSDLSTIINSVVDKISDTTERNLRHVLSSTANLMGYIDDRPYDRRVLPALDSRNVLVTLQQKAPLAVCDIPPSNVLVSTATISTPSKTLGKHFFFHLFFTISPFH